MLAEPDQWYLFGKCPIWGLATPRRVPDEIHRRWWENLEAQLTSLGFHLAGLTSETQAWQQRLIGALLWHLPNR